MWCGRACVTLHQSRVRVKCLCCGVRCCAVQGKGEQRICKLQDSPCMPESDATFMIAKKGVVDVD